MGNKREAILYVINEIISFFVRPLGIITLLILSTIDTFTDFFIIGPLSSWFANKWMNDFLLTAHFTWTIKEETSKIYLAEILTYLYFILMCLLFILSLVKEFKKYTKKTDENLGIESLPLKLLSKIKREKSDNHTKINKTLKVILDSSDKFEQVLAVQFYETNIDHDRDKSNCYNLKFAPKIKPSYIKYPKGNIDYVNMDLEPFDFIIKEQYNKCIEAFRIGERKIEDFILNQQKKLEDVEENNPSRISDQKKTAFILLESALVANYNGERSIEEFVDTKSDFIQEIRKVKRLNLPVAFIVQRLKNEPSVHYSVKYSGSEHKIGRHYFVVKIQNLTCVITLSNKIKSSDAAQSIGNDFIARLFKGLNITTPSLNIEIPNNIKEQSLSI